MDEECQKLLAEKEETIRDLQEKIKELEMKLKAYEIRDVYRGIIPDDVLEKLVKLPPDQMVIEIGKYLREKAAGMESEVKERNDKISKLKEGISEVASLTKDAEVEATKAVELITGTVKAKVGVDLNFAQKYDFEGSDIAFLGEDLMETLKVEEGNYVTVRKNGSVNLRVMSYSKKGFVIVPTWVREKLGVKINDFVEVSRK
ncbi:hypothetical protein [Archaeoglobus neptunius]|uniref:hypothetical protein n=1 Tax=Archaeoglobus neptunius TaxID=2798580 RepID=UPI001927CDE7|nr:hypothetical protein [Archaeoglobus neptunius]